MTVTLAEALEALRAAEKAQSLRYRTLAALAEAAGDEATAQRLHDLHADEQHHLSRLSARLIELGTTPAEVVPGAPGPLALAGWETEARRREEQEVARYRAFLTTDPDAVTRALVEGILAVEEHHRDELGGKWTIA